MNASMSENKELLVNQVYQQIDLFNSLLKNKSDDLYIFNKYILDVERGKQELGVFHKELCHFVQDNLHKKKLILMPRGHLKSTLVTIGYSTQRIVKNPNVRILVLSATWQMAVDFLTEIKNHLQNNEKIQELWPEIAEAVATPSEWAQDRITIKRTDTNIKGPTVWAAGVESNLVGSHPDVIIFDDVVSRDNVTTPEQIDKVKLRYKDALDLLEPGGQLIIIGTRWAEGDLYSWLMDKDNGISQSYDIMIKRAYEGDLETSEGFVPLWPEKFTQKELLTRQREKGWYEFSAQYLNDPIPDKDATFQAEWIQKFDIEDVRGKDMIKVLTIDPAISLEKQADYTAMIVTGIDTFGNIFVLDAVRERLTPSQLIDNIFRLNEMWHPNSVGIETVAYQKAIAYSLKDEMQKRRRYMPIVELKPNERSKDLRIRGLQPQYQAMKVWHRRDHPITPYLEAELKAFPRGIHDDLIDAFSYALDLLYPPKQHKARYQGGYLY